MTISIHHNDRNSYTTSDICQYDAMISSLAKVMGLRIDKKVRAFLLTQRRIEERGSMCRKIIQHDQSFN